MYTLVRLSKHLDPKKNLVHNATALEGPPLSWLTEAPKKLSDAIMQNVQSWVHERLEGKPELQKQIQELFKWLSEDVQWKLKDPAFFQEALQNYITNTEWSIASLKEELKNAKTLQESANLESALKETQLAYTRGLINLTRIHAGESNNTDLMREIGDISANLVVEESRIKNQAHEWEDRVKILSHQFVTWNFS